MKKQNIDKIVDSLGKMDPSMNDLYEDLGILVSDFNDMIKQTNADEFNKQKTDCGKTLKSFKKSFWNLTFKNTKNMRTTAK